MKKSILIALIVLSILICTSAMAGLQDVWSINSVGPNLNNRAMAFNPTTGHLLVGGMNQDTCILVFDTTGNFITKMNMNLTVSTYSGNYMVYDLDVTNDGVIYALHYTTGTIYRWENESAAPTVACAIGGINIRGMKVLGTGANTMIYTTFTGSSVRVFAPVSSSNYTTFQLSEQFGDASTGSWSILASGDTSNTALYAILAGGNRLQYSKFNRTNGVWSRDSAFMPPFKWIYYFKGDICPTNNDLYFFRYLSSGDTPYPGSTTRRDAAIIRIDGNTGIQKEMYELATTSPQIFRGNMGDISFDTTNYMLYWMYSVGTAFAAPADQTNFKLGGVKYTDDPGCLRVVEIPEITIDGSTTDWPSYVNETAAGWSCYAYNTSWGGPADYSGKVKVAWNHRVNKLYVLAEVADDITYSLDTWSNNWNAEDLAEIYFNPTNYYLGSSLTKVSQMIIKTNGMQRAGGFGTYNTFQNFPYLGAQIAINTTAVVGKRFIEISVPLYNSYDTTGAGVIHSLIPNEFIGFEADFVDQDVATNATANKYYSVTPGTGKFASPERIGTVWIKGVITSPDFDHTLAPSATEQFTQTYGKAPITWNSSNLAAGSISSTGLFTAAAVGVTSVYATDADGVKSVPVVITVTATDAPVVNDIKE